MKKYFLLAYFCLACLMNVVAQNTKHEKFGLTWQLPNDWQLSDEKNSDTQFYAHPTAGGQAKVDLRILSAKNDDEAEKATITFMQNNNIPPAFLSDIKSKKVKQGGLQMQIFEKDGIDLKLDNGTTLYVHRKLVLINTDAGKKYILHMLEYYADNSPKQKEAIENVIKTLKVK